jgi:hypothetical protein
MMQRLLILLNSVVGHAIWWSFAHGDGFFKTLLGSKALEPFLRRSALFPLRFQEHCLCLRNRRFLFSWIGITFIMERRRTATMIPLLAEMNEVALVRVFVRHKGQIVLTPFSFEKRFLRDIAVKENIPLSGVDLTTPLFTAKVISQGGSTAALVHHKEIIGISWFRQGLHFLFYCFPVCLL